MKEKIKNPIQPDWISKTIAGGFFGFTFSIAIANLIMILGKPYIDVALLRQVSMWSVPWLWMPIFFGSYFIPKGRTALAILFLLNLFAFFCLFLLRD